MTGLCVGSHLLLVPHPSRPWAVLHGQHYVPMHDRRDTFVCFDFGVSEGHAIAWAYVVVRGSRAFRPNAMHCTQAQSLVTRCSNAGCAGAQCVGAHDADVKAVSVLWGSQERCLGIRPVPRAGLLTTKGWAARVSPGPCSVGNTPTATSDWFKYWPCGLLPAVMTAPVATRLATEWYMRGTVAFAPVACCSHCHLPSTWPSPWPQDIQAHYSARMLVGGLTDSTSQTADDTKSSRSQNLQMTRVRAACVRQQHMHGAKLLAAHRRRRSWRWC